MRSIRTLLINVPDRNETRGGEPLGLEYLAAYLRKHRCRCDILDLNFGKSKKLSVTQVAKLVAKKNCGLIGMTVFTHLFHNTMRLAAAIKKASPKSRIVFGGHHVTFTHEKILRGYPFIDLIVRGEGEITLLELVESRKKGKGPGNVKGLTYRGEDGIRVNPPRPLIDDISSLPFPARSEERFKAQPRSWHGAAIVTSRGCPGRCSFCSISAFYADQPGRHYRMRSPANIAAEIESLAKRFDIKQVAFKDDNMFEDARRLIKVTDILEKKGISLKYNIVARPDSIVKNEKYLPKLKKRGFVSVEVGIEAGSDNILRRFAKNISVDTNKRAMEILQRNGIHTMLDYIMFEPDMTIKDFRENVDFIRDLGVMPFMSRSFVFGSLLHSVDLHPGTAYYDRLINEGRTRGGVFSPKWGFKDPDMGRAHDFISVYRKTLSKKIGRMKRLRKEAVIELNRQKKTTGKDAPMRRAVLKHMDYKLDRVYLDLLHKTIVIGRRDGFGKKGFAGVRSAMEDRLKELRRELLCLRANAHKMIDK